MGSLLVQFDTFFGEAAHYHNGNRRERDEKGSEWSDAICIPLLR